MIFEMLAFKNDVSHWRKKKDNIGTSAVSQGITISISFPSGDPGSENEGYCCFSNEGSALGILCVLGCIFPWIRHWFTRNKAPNLSTRLVA
jgi:hypothetical protein